MLDLAFDPGDLELGEVVAEADCLVKSLAALEFEGHAFLAAMLFNDPGGDARTLDGGSPDLGLAAIMDEEDLAEPDFLISFHGKLVDTDGVACRDAVLLAAGFEDCVGHGSRIVGN